MYILRIINSNGGVILNNNYRTMKEVIAVIMSLDTSEASIFVNKRYGET
jgi:hypothetical protein